VEKSIWEKKLFYTIYSSNIWLQWLQDGLVPCFPLPSWDPFLVLQFSRQLSKYVSYLVLLLVDMVWSSTTILPTEAKEGWDFWEKNISSLEPYTKEVQFFQTFNIAWIFSWEYRLQDHLLNSFPLSMVWIYKIKWWNEYKTKLCGKENVQYFWKTKTKKFTLHNLHTFEKKKEIATGPSTPAKRESPTTSTKARVKGSSQKEWEILELLKDDPIIRQIFLQKILDKTDDLDDEIVSSASSSSKPKQQDYQDS